MSYMLLVIQQPDNGVRLPPEEGRRRYQSMMGFAKDLADRGLLVAGESLGTDANGVRVAKRGGKQTVIDGPFAEAKEIVGGFFLLNCETREEAVAIASTCPAAEWSTVEVREVGDCLENPD